MKRISTGIKGLDDMLGGGLPSGRCILVCGGPGSGKTILSIQFLYNGVTKYNETGLYVALGESPIHLKEDLGGFGWDIERLEKDKKLVIVDASPLRTIPRSVQVGKISLGKQDFRMLSLIEVIKSRTKEIGAKRVVIDSISSLILQYPDETERRNAILDLFEAVTNLGATSLIATELRATALEREVQTEEFLSHGVIVFHTFKEGGRMIRAIQIEKMRGISHDHQLRPYKIYKNGVEVFSKESVLAGA
ncbi:MAG: ATPase [Candidatus Bathyarchaeota archaeon]|jgi:KaiC/GvpD/RAD55 family RecA-like ATPase|nr:MAG: ATPase [Candidatus Bathyarchaeota archaeon]